MEFEEKEEQSPSAPMVSSWIVATTGYSRVGKDPDSLTYPWVRIGFFDPDAYDVALTAVGRTAAAEFGKSSEGSVVLNIKVWGNETGVFLQGLSGWEVEMDEDHRDVFESLAKKCGCYLLELVSMEKVRKASGQRYLIVAPEQAFREFVDYKPSVEERFITEYPVGIIKKL